MSMKYEILKRLAKAANIKRRWAGMGTEELLESRRRENAKNRIPELRDDAFDFSIVDVDGSPVLKMIHRTPATHACLFIIGGGMISAPRPGSIKKALRFAKETGLDLFVPYYPLCTEYPITKAYEMSSCFMGLLEYYRITGVERYRTAVENFAAKVLENDFTIAGSGGLGHELFDHSAVRQANPNIGDTPQETCVTVTLMQLFSQLALFTGDPKYLDAFERSLYNAYLGAVNTEKVKVTPVSSRDGARRFRPIHTV